jgi:hypothetical protein
MTKNRQIPKQNNPKTQNPEKICHAGLPNSGISPSKEKIIDLFRAKAYFHHLFHSILTPNRRIMTELYESYPPVRTNN